MSTAADIIVPIIDLIKLLFGLKISFIFLIFDILFYSFIPEFITNQKIYCYILGLFCISVIIVNIIYILYEKYKQNKRTQDIEKMYKDLANKK